MFGILATMILCLTPTSLNPGGGHSCSVGVDRPTVHTIGGMVRVDNRCNRRDALVIVYRPYENSSETFWAPGGAYVAEPTLHTGRMKVWVRFNGRGDGHTYSKTMKPAR